MKKVILLTTLLSASISALATPVNSQFFNPIIAVPAYTGVNPPTVTLPDIAIEGNKLFAAKLCLAWDATTEKHVEARAFIFANAGDAEPVWFGAVSQDCTSLDQIPSWVALGENPVLKLSCRNFDSVARNCRVKAVVYTGVAVPE